MSTFCSKYFLLISRQLNIGISRVFSGVNQLFHSEINPLWFGLCVVIALLFPCLELLGFYLEDLQTLLYSLIALCFLASLGLGVRRSSFTVIFPLLLIPWLAGAFHIRGYLPDRNSFSGAMTRLSRDSSAKETSQELAIKINEVNSLYGSNRLRLIPRSLNSTSDAKLWIESNPGVTHLIYGQSDWPTVELQGQSLYGQRLLPFSSPVYPSSGSLCPSHSLSHTLLIAKPGSLPVDLCLVLSPERFKLPFREPELARHFLSFFNEGLSRLHSEISPLIDPGEWRRRPFSQAAEIVGPWGNKVPLGTARFFLGTLYITDHLTTEQFFTTNSGLDCALQELRKSLKLAYAQEAPEVNAAILNNIAVVQVLQAQNKQDFATALKTLNRMLAKKSPQSPVFVGHHAALFNLINLNKLGVH